MQKTEAEQAADYHVYTNPEIPFVNIRIVVTDNSVIIQYLSEQSLSFSVTHPLMRVAFVSYVEQLKERKKE